MPHIGKRMGCPAKMDALDKHVVRHQQRWIAVEHGRIVADADGHAGTRAKHRNDVLDDGGL